MTDKKSADLTIQIGEMVVENFEFTRDDWESVSIVATFFEGSQRCSGYQYFADGSYEAGGMSNYGEFLDTLIELRDHMKDKGEGAFVQCLIHVTRPMYKLRIQYEHNNPKRWWPNQTASMQEFAELLRPVKTAM